MLCISKPANISFAVTFSWLESAAVKICHPDTQAPFWQSYINSSVSSAKMYCLKVNELLRLLVIVGNRYCPIFKRRYWLITSLEQNYEGDVSAACTAWRYFGRQPCPSPLYWQQAVPDSIAKGPAMSINRGKAEYWALSSLSLAQLVWWYRATLVITVRHIQSI